MGRFAAVVTKPVFILAAMAVVTAMAQGPQHAPHIDHQFSMLVQVSDKIDSAHRRVGDPVRLELVLDATDGHNRVVLRKGATLTGVVTCAEPREGDQESRLAIKAIVAHMKGQDIPLNAVIWTLLPRMQGLDDWPRGRGPVRLSSNLGELESVELKADKKLGTVLVSAHKTIAINAGTRFVLRHFPEPPPEARD
jgi:hypothetical protein